VTTSAPISVAVAPSARWLLFAVISAIYFTISAATFSSLGIVLPRMIQDLSWSWSQAGTGFSLLALLVGLASALPAWTIRRFGIAATYGIGGTIMVIGFGLLALTSGIYSYLIAAALLGLGFALCAVVPAVYLLNGWMPHKRSAFIGAYMTIGGLGAVAGPLSANGFMNATHSWRLYWWAMAALMLVLTVLALIFVRSPPIGFDGGEKPDAAAAAREDRHRSSGRDWSFREAVRSSQYWVISLSMTATLLCVLTTSSLGPAHMLGRGVSAGLAAGVLSINGAVGALSRYLGGALATRIDPKWLLVAALIAEGIGMAALSVVGSRFTLSVFAVSEGFGFGMCLLATTLLLVNYFGPSENPAIYGTFNLITTLAMVGPYIGGLIKDLFGGFGALFQSYAILLLLIVVMATAMRPPVPKPR
jgi:MFS transporter, OFA family, oxalate/formate antiporter